MFNLVVPNASDQARLFGQSIMQAIAEQSRMVRLPLNRVGALNKMGKVYRDLEQEYERQPSAQELATELDMNVDEVAYTLQIAGRHVSMDAPRSEERRVGQERRHRPSPG